MSTIFSNTSAPHSPRPCPGDCASCCVYLGNGCVICCTSGYHQRPIIFQDSQEHNGLMMAPDPNRPPWNQVPYSLPSNIFSQGTHNITYIKEKGHSKMKHGAKNPLYGTNLCGCGLWGTHTPNLIEWDQSTLVWSNNLRSTIENSLRPPEYVYCLYSFSSPWMPLYKAALTTLKPLLNSPGSNSFFFCGQASTIKVTPTHCQHHSKYRISSSPLEICQPQPLLQPFNNALQKILSVSSSLIRRTDPKGNKSATIPHDTPGNVQWKPSGAEWHILDTMAPTATTHWSSRFTRTNRYHCKALPLPSTSEL